MLSPSSLLIRPDPPVSTTPADFPVWLVIRQVFARRSGLGCPQDLPPLWVNTPSLRAIIPTPGGEVVTPQLVTTSKAFRNRVRRQLLHSPDTCFCRVNLTTLQCSLHATARRLASPPVQVRPGVPQPTRTFTPELSRGGSPEPRVGYDYTTPLGRDCDRTFTGWSAAVMGCALCWLIPRRSESKA